jgi:hypothetical protein
MALTVALLLHAATLDAQAAPVGFAILISDQLKQSRATKAEEAQAIYKAADDAKRAPTAEEKTKFDGLMVEVDALCARIESQLKIEAVLKDKPADRIPALLSSTTTTSQ